jgi:hypothetical protein
MEAVRYCFIIYRIVDVGGLIYFFVSFYDIDFDSPPFCSNHLYLMDEKYTHSHTFERPFWPNKQMRLTLFRGFPACLYVTGMCVFP